MKKRRSLPIMVLGTDSFNCGYEIERAEILDRWSQAKSTRDTKPFKAWL
jgi:hypothetical protein